jgi:signal transduction histidine kinase
MTNPTTTTPRANDTWPLRTVRCAAGLIVASALITLANQKLVTDSVAALDLADTLFSLAVGCALFTLTFFMIFREHWRSITWIACALIVACDGVTGARHGEIVMFLVTVMLMMLGSSAILPWSVRWQGSFNVLCVVAWSAMRLGIGRPDPEEAAQWLGVLTASVIAQAVTAMRERYVAHLKNSEDELIESRERALAASRAKSEFLSSMSHEIRTPLNAILGMTELLLETPYNPEQRRYLDTMMDNGNALLGLINDVLDLARVESGKLTLERVNFDLADLVQRLTQTLDMRAREKGLAMTARIDPDVPTGLVGDPLRLRQVLVNLVGNATKFTERGSITLRVSRDRSGEPGSIQFSVADTGIGIAPRDLEHIFATFTQADSSTARKYGGSGLGLSIAKRLVELMGGEIRANSELGRGSTFSFSARFGLQDISAQLAALPALNGNGAAHPTRAPSSPSRPLRILVADDSADNRMLISAFLKNTPYYIDEVENGALAVEQFVAHKYDLVLMDIQMPVMDGHAATRAIRDWERDNHRTPTPIVALSAAALSESFISSRAAGCDEHVTKPIRKAALLEVIDRTTA